MDILTSIAEFNALKSRLTMDRNIILPTVIISAGTCGQASGANDLIRVAKRIILEEGLLERMRLRITGCHGFCEMEPSILVEPDRTFYPRLKPEAVPEVKAESAE